MARARDIIIRFLGDERDLVRSGKKVESATGSISKSFSGLQKLMGGAVIGAAIGVAKAWGDMATAALDDSKSIDTLHASIRQNTDATDSQIAANDKWIDSMQIATLVADTDLRQAMQSLVAVGATVEESQRIIAVAIDTAAQRGLEFNTVINAMIKAQTGMTTGLGRLGVATRDASGEALTFDEILTDLEKTMGGAAATAASTLAGGVERARIIMEEANEEAGKGATGPWSKLGDLWTVLNELIKTGQAELSTINEEFNDLVRSGVNPANDAIGSTIEILEETLKVSSVSRDTFGTLRAMLGLTTDDFDVLAEAIRQAGEDGRFTNEQVEALLDQLAHDAGPSGFHTMLMRTKAGAQETAEEIRGVTDAMLEMVSPALQMSNAANAVADAEEAYIEAVQEHSALSEEAERAGINLAEAHLRLEAASSTFAEEGGQASIDALVQILQDAGVLKETIDRVVESMKRLNSTPVRGNLFAAPQRRPGQTGGQFDKGGVVPGPRGAPMTAIVHGGETILPTHKKALPRYDEGTGSSLWDRMTAPRPLGNGEVMTADGRRLAGGAAQAYLRDQRRRNSGLRQYSVSMNVNGFADSVEAYRHAREIERHLDRQRRQRAR